MPGPGQGQIRRRGRSAASGREPRLESAHSGPTKGISRVTLASVLLLGFLLGMRHALEADHLAAVASLATTSSSLISTMRQGVAWGAGHTMTLLLFGGAVVLLGKEVPPGAARLLEAMVGAMLVLLGATTLYRLRRDRVNPHGTRWPARAMVVGMVHGLAGSAALVLLSVQAIRSAIGALAYIGIFGLGSIIGMALSSAMIAMPLRLSARYLAGAHVLFTSLIGLATVALGSVILYRIGIAGSLTLQP